MRVSGREGTQSQEQNPNLIKAVVGSNTLEFCLDGTKINGENNT